MIGGRVSVVVFRPGEPNRWGESTLVPAATVRRCTVAPGTSTEPGEWANAVESEVTILAPYDADVRATDEVEVEGLQDADGNPLRWAVVGDPARWRSPFSGTRRGASIALRRVGG